MEDENSLCSRLAACLCAGRSEYEDALVPIPESIDCDSLLDWISRLEGHPPTSSRLRRLQKVRTRFSHRCHEF